MAVASAKAKDVFGNPVILPSEEISGTFQTATPDQRGQILNELVNKGVISPREGGAKFQVMRDFDFSSFQPDVLKPQPGAGVVSSSASVVADEKNTQNLISNLSQPSPNEERIKNSYQQVFDLIEAERKRLETQRAEETSRIERQFAEAKAGTEKAQAREFASTTTTLARIGGFLGGVASHVGALNNLAASHRTELASLEAKKADAIQAANSAISEKQFKLAREKADEIKSLDKDIEDRRNKFFDQSMQIIREKRLQEEEDRQKAQQDFKNQLDITSRVAPTVVEALEQFDSEVEAANYIQNFARDLKIDPNILIGEVNKIAAERREDATKAVISLAQKYPDAGISTTDIFEVAAEKVRTKSKSYQLDITKAETDIANSRSLMAKRAADKEVDFSDPILGIYTQATGDVVSTPNQARGIMGYAESLLADKEIVEDDFQGPLLDNQIRASDAQKNLADAFTKLKPKTPEEKKDQLPEGTVWQWLATEAAQILTDADKANFIRGSGHDPEDFGIYE